MNMRFWFLRRICSECSIENHMECVNGLECECKLCEDYIKMMKP